MSFAKGSAGEVRAFLLIAEEVQLIDKNQAQRLREQAIRVSKRLYRFILSLEARFQLKRGRYRDPFPPST
jgi:four helix bundle protein